jgi:hypothetical protein
VTATPRHHRLPAAALALLAGAGAATAQTALFSNAGPIPSVPAISTGTLAASGAPAPPGASWSELQSDSSGADALAGVSCHRLLDGSTAFRVADDFDVAPGGWSLDRLDVFVYQTGFDGPTSPFAAATARVWWGIPDAPGSVLIWGDTFTNRLVDAQATDVYRIFNSTAAPFPEPATAARRVWRASLNLAGLHLTEGHYWVDWQFDSDTQDQEVFAVPATIAGARGTPSANALRLDWRLSPVPAPPAPPVPAWQPALDPGKPAVAPDVPRDFAFILLGTPAQPACIVDWDHNGVVNSTDVAMFINSWFEDQASGTLTADFDGNGITNSTDVSDFINTWFGSQPYCS